MASVVQATCPGCKTVLRIPADWIHQSIRCKKCGTVLQARPARGSSRPGSSPSPAPRKAVPPSPAPPAARVPVAPQAPAAEASPFESFGHPDAEEPRSPRRRRRRSGGPWWQGPVIALGILVLAGVGLAVAWPWLKGPLLNGPPAPLAEREGIGPGFPGHARRTATAATGDGDVGTEGRPRGNLEFPRRALVISIHNYLYANPIHDGTGNARNIPNLLGALNKGLRIPMTQMAHLSDAAVRGQARPPLKAVIEQSLTNFLDTSRPQDRILVFFIGHCAVSGGQVYLAPIEGELDRPDTLIPLRWFYDRLDHCKAREKVLVLDVNRYNPTLGLERPASGPMDDTLDRAIKAPPAGVEVWAACSLKQFSYETDERPMGVFLDQLEVVLAPEPGEKGYEGKIQRPDDLLPLARLNDLINSGTRDELAQHKLAQTSRVTGAPREDGAAYDRNEAPPPAPELARVHNQGTAARFIQEVRAEISTPPIKVSADEMASNFDVLPPFDPAALKKYDDEGKPNGKLQMAVRRARVMLWAVSSSGEPPELMGEVKKVRQELGPNGNLSILQNGFRAPAPGDAENKFKQRVFENEREVSDILLRLEEALGDLKEAGSARKKAPPRWQANYDFILARLEEQIAYLYEYQSLLGQMRKEFPPRDPNIQFGWRLAARPELQGDTKGKKLVKTARKQLDQLVKDNPGTPWEVLGKREKLTALGLEWQPTR